MKREAKMQRAWVLLAVAVLQPAIVARADSVVRTQAGDMQITTMADGLTEPWAVAFLPDGSYVVTERAGRLLHFASAAMTEIGGLPRVIEGQQGGLLDVMIPRDFATSREIWLSYARPSLLGYATAVGKGRLSDDGTTLEDFDRLYAGDALRGEVHFGSRLVEAGDGTVFMTTGDRGSGPDGMNAQDPMRVEGKVIHLNRDGSPATSLPGARPGVYSLGHRNAQGAALGADGALWLVEHGAQGGDELNRVEEGRNYGWPVISYGENYGGGRIGTGAARDGMEQPLHYWVPSIAPSGLLQYSGALVAAWQGDWLTGSLNSDFISRLDPEAGYAEERIASAETGRVRDIVEAPDGSIWFLSVLEGKLYRMAPVP